MPSTNTPKTPPLSPLTHIAGKAGCIAGLLAVLDLLPEAEHGRALETCASMANDVARDLTSLVIGAA